MTGHARVLLIFGFPWVTAVLSRRGRIIMSSSVYSDESSEESQVTVSDISWRPSRPSQFHPEA